MGRDGHRGTTVPEAPPRRWWVGAAVATATVALGLAALTWGVVTGLPAAYTTPDPAAPTVRASQGPAWSGTVPDGWTLVPGSQRGTVELVDGSGSRIVADALSQDAAATCTYLAARATQTRSYTRVDLADVTVAGKPAVGVRLESAASVVELRCVQTADDEAWFLELTCTPAAFAAAREAYEVFAASFRVR